MKRFVQRFFSVLTAGVILSSSQTVTAYDDSISASLFRETAFRSVRTADLGDAEEISLNTDVTDSLTDKTDENAYRFILTDAGYITVDYSRGWIDDGSVYWRLFLYDTSEDENLIWQKDYSGNAYANSQAMQPDESGRISEQSLHIGLAAGTYKIVLKAGTAHFSDLDYTMQIRFMKDRFRESEYNDTAETADKLTLNQQIIGDLWKADDIDMYTFTLPDDGCVTFDFTHPNMNDSYRYWRLTVCDAASGEQVYQKSMYGNETAENPVMITTPEIGMGKGTYTAEIRSESGTAFSSAEYMLCVNFTEDRNWETESNNTIETADRLELHTDISGILANKDDRDWYVFEVTDQGYLNVAFSYPYYKKGIASWVMSLYDTADPSQALLYSTYQGKDKDTDGGTITEYSRNIGLDKGTYAIQIRPYDNTSHKDLPYSVRVNFIKDKHWEAERNNTPDTADPLPLNSYITGGVQYERDNDWYRFTLTQDSTVVIDLARRYAIVSDRIWEVYLYPDADGEAGEKIWSTYYTGDDIMTQLPSPVVFSSPEFELEAGSYYIKIKQHNSIYALDYMLSVRTTEEQYIVTSTSPVYTTATTGTGITTTAKKTTTTTSKTTTSKTTTSKTTTGKTTTSKTTTSKTTTTKPVTSTTTQTTAKQLLPTMPGDVDCNNTRDVGDAVLLARFLAEDTEAEVTEQGKVNADCNKSGDPDPNDIVLILKAIARLITL